jgi:hypothetical protein
MYLINFCTASLNVQTIIENLLVFAALYVYEFFMAVCMASVSVFQIFREWSIPQVVIKVPGILKSCKKHQMLSGNIPSTYV